MCLEDWTFFFCLPIYTNDNFLCLCTGICVKTGQVVFDKIMNVHCKTEDNQRKSTDSNRWTESLRRPYIPFNKSPTAIYMCSPTFNKVLSTELLLSKYVNINATCYTCTCFTPTLKFEILMKLEILWAMLTKWYPPLPHVLYGKVLILLWETPKSFE